MNLNAIRPKPRDLSVVPPRGATFQAVLRQQAEAIRASNAELEQFNRAMVGRELRMIELKQEINELCRRLGEPPRHAAKSPPADRVTGAGPAPEPPGGGGA